MGQSAVVILVAEAEPVVAGYRLQHDPAAASGVPAHVTVLFPFRPVVDDDVARRLAAIAGAAEPFDVSFIRTERFSDEGVLYLAPEPAAPIRALIDQLVAAFPDCPPYGGAIADPVPHLTVGMQLAPDEADRIADELAAGLPITTTVDRLTLLVRDGDGRWNVDQGWPLGAGGR
jgi:hypothetical protein